MVIIGQGSAAHGDTKMALDVIIVEVKGRGGSLHFAKL